MPFSTSTVRRVGRPSPSKGAVPKPPTWMVRGAGTAVVGEGFIKYKRAVVDDGDIVAGDALAELAGEEGGMAVDGVAVGGVENVADDGGGYLRRKDHGSALGLDPPRTQPAQGAAGSFLADVDGVFQQHGGARGGVQ